MKLQHELPLRVTGGANHTSHVFHNNTHAVKKRLLKEPKASLKNLVREHAFAKTPALAYRDTSNRATALDEARVLRHWKAAGIPAPDVQIANEDRIITQYIPGKPYSDVLQHYDTEAFDRLIHTKQQITALARHKDDVTLLHLDPHLDNFIDTGRQAYAIDPGVTPLPGADLEQTLAQSRIYFLHRLDETPHADALARRYVQSLSAQEQEHLRQENTYAAPTAAILCAAADLRNTLQGKRVGWLRHADPRQKHRIDTYLDQTT